MKYRRFTLNEIQVDLLKSTAKEHGLMVTQTL